MIPAPQFCSLGILLTLPLGHQYLTYLDVVAGALAVEEMGDAEIPAFAMSVYQARGK